MLPGTTASLSFFSVPPTFAMEQTGSTQTANVNQEGPTIKCVVIGDRPLHISWRRNGIDITTSTSSRRQFTVSFFVFALISILIIESLGFRLQPRFTSRDKIHSSVFTALEFFFDDLLFWLLLFDAKVQRAELTCHVIVKRSICVKNN